MPLWSVNLTQIIPRSQALSLGFQVILTCQTDNIKGLALCLCGGGFLGSVKERAFVHLHTTSVNITAASLWPWEDAPIPCA